MAPKLFEDDDDDSQHEDISKFEVDENYGRRLEYNRTRQDLQKYEERKKRGDISSSDESSEEYEPDDEIGNPKKDLKFFESLIKVRKQDPSLKNKDVKLFESDDDGEDEEDGDDENDEKGDKKKKNKKKMLLKDVQAKHLIEEGPEFDVDVEEKVKTYAEEQEELRKALLDAVEAADKDDDDDEDLLRVKQSRSEDLEVDDGEFVKKVDEYFGEDAKLDENAKFLRDFFTKQMWKEREEKGKMVAGIDESELDELEEDEVELERQEEYETSFRHEEEDAGALKNYPRRVEDSVRNKENPRKVQRKSKEERMRVAEMERREELKRLKNVKKREIKEKMQKVLAIAGFKEGEGCPFNPKDLDEEFDPEEYDEMMKSVFDEKYYDEEDSGLGSDEDEKPDFDKEDELLGLPKDWDVIKPGDGFLAAREKTLKQKEDIIGDEGIDEDEEEEGSDKEEEEEEGEGEEEEGEEATEGKRKRKRKASLVQRAKEALMEEYYKLDYEDTIGDLKTRFRYAKVEPNRFGLKTEEVLELDDKDLNQFVSLKKIAPYREKEWKLHQNKKHEQKLKVKELLKNKKSGHRKRRRDDKDDGKKKPRSDEKKEEADDSTSKLSRKAKRRRRQAELKPSQSRLMGYQKARVNMN